VHPAWLFSFDSGRRARKINKTNSITSSLARAPLEMRFIYLSNSSVAVSSERN
jgi:hypothetical protein